MALAESRDLIERFELGLNFGKITTEKNMVLNVPIITERYWTHFSSAKMMN